MAQQALKQKTRRRGTKTLKVRKEPPHQARAPLEKSRSKLREVKMERSSRITR